MQGKALFLAKNCEKARFLSKYRSRKAAPPNEPLFFNGFSHIPFYFAGQEAKKLAKPQFFAKICYHYCTERISRASDRVSVLQSVLVCFNVSASVLQIVSPCYSSPEEAGKQRLDPGSHKCSTIFYPSRWLRGPQGPWAPPGSWG